MAGIGFRLQKLLSGDSIFDSIQAYLYAAVIAAGPMLVVIVNLAILRSFFQSQLSYEEGQSFLGIIIYVYAFSTIGVSPFIYVVTRFLADKHFSKEIQAFTPSYISNIELVFLLQSLLALPFLYFLEIDIVAKWLSFSLFLIVSGIWIAMIFLSAAKSYLWIVFAFVIGTVTGIIASLFFTKLHSFWGVLQGFTLGQFISFLILTLRIFREFGFKVAKDYEFLSYFKKYPLLSFIGVFYYLGIWIDKFVFWFSEKSSLIAGVIRVYPDYDSPMFLAFLTIIPSMAYFLMQMETNFYESYRDYYTAVRHKAPLDIIRARKKEIIKVLASHFAKFSVFQGLISGLIILFIVDIAEVFFLNPFQTSILRIGILGSFLMMGFIMILLVLFYFDFQKEVLFLTILYTVLNGVFSYVSLGIGIESYGFAYTAASFLAVLIGFFVMDHKLKYLNYWTFMAQPIFIPQFKFEKESVRRSRA